MANFNYNKITVAGRITEDPKLATTPSGVSVCQFAVAVNGRPSDEPIFFTVDAWRDRAEFVSRYFRRGSSVCVDGRVRVHSWVGKDGGRRKDWIIDAQEIYFVDSRSEMPEDDVEPDEVDLANARPTPQVWGTPGARGKIAEEMQNGDEEMPF